MHKNRLVFAKKLRLPSTRANVLQSLNMALAFTATGRDVRCFPGCAAVPPSFPASLSPPVAERRRMTLLGAMRGLGMENIPPSWQILSGEHKGIYGSLFRWALMREYWRDKNVFYYARDTSEAAFLCSVSRWLPLTLVFEAHEVLHLLQKNSGKSRWQWTLHREKKIFSCISGLVVINEGILEDVRSVFSYKGPVLVAENGFNPALFHPLPLFEPEYPWPGAADVVNLVYVGNFLPGKGVRVLLDALKMLPERFRLRLVGGQPEDMVNYLRDKAAKLRLTHRVDFYGAVPQHDVAKACKGAHIFMVPQQSGFFFSPLKLYEAIAMGLPVIVTPLSIFKAHIDAGFVCGAPDRGASGLAAAIEQLAGNETFARALREKALLEAKEHTWEKRAQKIIEFIDSLPPPFRKSCALP